MKINKRLKQVGDYISEESIPLDVGCDHAKLSIYLLKERNFPFVYASDNKEGPLNQAKGNISFYNFEDRIKLSKKDGLASLEENIDTITITGMGGLTICKIFKENELATTKQIWNKLQSQGIVLENPLEKIHIILNLVDQLCHEMAYHKHKEINYEVMKDEVVKLILSILK